MRPKEELINKRYKDTVGESKFNQLTCKESTTFTESYSRLASIGSPTTSAGIFDNARAA